MGERPDVAILSVRLRSGAFESSVSIPIDESREKKDEAVQRWLKLIAFALENGVTEMSANLGDRDNG